MFLEIGALNYTPKVAFVIVKKYMKRRDKKVKSKTKHTPDYDITFHSFSVFCCFSFMEQSEHAYILKMARLVVTSVPVPPTASSSHNKTAETKECSRG